MHNSNPSKQKQNKNKKVNNKPHKSQSKKSLTTKPTRQPKLPKQLSRSQSLSLPQQFKPKLKKSTAFAATTPQFGLWDTPQDLPTSPKTKYVDFFKDTPVNGLAQQLVRDLRDFALVQTGGPAYFDRDYEQQKLLGTEQFAAYKKQLADNNYGTFQSHDELDFQTSYYKRVDMVPATASGTKLRINPTHTFFRESPDHIVQWRNVTDPDYIDFRDHEAKHTGVVTAGPYFVPRVPFQFPILSVDNDYLYFHD